VSPSTAAVVLALFEARGALLDVPRRRVVDLLEVLGSVDPLVRETTSGLDPMEPAILARLRDALRPEAITRWTRLLDDLAAGPLAAGVTTVLDDGYPANLRRAREHPPFVFHRGSIGAAAVRSVAVVGTRRPSRPGLDAAVRIAHDLADAGIAVVSGLAVGIDTAAHEATLLAGRPTVAVLGHGISRPVHPSGNRDLAERIVKAGGALISPFWADQVPTRTTFPRRNSTTSGLALATVVVEAGERSGARQAARVCVEQRRLLFIFEPLAATSDWARRYAGRPGVTVFTSADQILDQLDRYRPPPAPAVQRALA
jgi:DNA processing protein